MNDAAIESWAIIAAYRRTYSAGISDDEILEGYATDFAAEQKAIYAFARYIAQHEEAPIDPLLIEARNLVVRNSGGRYGPSQERRIEAGEEDRSEGVSLALSALRRGVEIGSAKA